MEYVRWGGISPRDGKGGWYVRVSSSVGGRVVPCAEHGEEKRKVRVEKECRRSRGMWSGVERMLLY